MLSFLSRLLCIFDPGGCSPEARLNRLELDGERIARRVIESAHKSDLDYMPIVVKAAGRRDKPTNTELESIKERANDVIPPTLARVSCLRPQPHKYIGGDFSNTHDGDLDLYLLIGFATLGMGFFVMPYVYNMLGKLNPSAYYRVYYKTSEERKAQRYTDIKIRRQ